MPRKLWQYSCCRREQGTAGGRPTCPSCGLPGEYIGWHYGMYEAMGRYQNMYGLKPIGPHRRLADELFAGVSVACQTCSGRGLLDVNAGEAWIPCQDCFGTGFVWTRTPEEVQALRQQVLEAFPDAGVETQVDLLSGIYVLNLANSTIENLHSEASGGEGNEGVP